MSALDEVIARLEKWESGREVDALIWCAVLPCDGKHPFDGYDLPNGCHYEHQPQSDGWVVAHVVTNGGKHLGLDNGRAARPAPPYTTSLDAAVSLVPEGWFWQVKRGFGYDAVVWSAEREGFWAGASQGGPALALCIAALKARRAKVRADAGSER